MTWTPELIAELKGYLDSNMSQVSIGRRMGLTKGQVGGAISRHNLLPDVRKPKQRSRSRIRSEDFAARDMVVFLPYPQWKIWNQQRRMGNVEV